MEKDCSKAYIFENEQRQPCWTYTKKLISNPFMNGDVSVYLASKLLMLFGIQLMDYADMFLQILLCSSLLLFAISWITSNIIIQKRAS